MDYCTLKYDIAVLARLWGERSGQMAIQKRGIAAKIDVTIFWLKSYLLTQKYMQCLACSLSACVGQL